MVSTSSSVMRSLSTVLSMIPSNCVGVTPIEVCPLLLPCSFSDSSLIPCPFLRDRVYIAPVLGANQTPPYFLTMTKSVFTERYKTFISLLVSARQKQGLTQRELAIRLNKVHSFVAKYEQGERRLDVIEFLDIAEALELNPIEIIKKLKKPSK